MKNLLSLILSTFVLILTLHNNVKAQDNTGTEFYFTHFAQGFINHFPGVYVVGNYDATVTIDYVARDPLQDMAGDPACTRYTFNLIGGTPQYVDIPYDLQALCFRYYDHEDSSEVVKTNGIKVTSTAPIALYSQFFASASSEMTPILPVTEMGTDYLITAHRELTFDGDDWMARTSIVGTENQTTVNITLPNYTWTSRYVIAVTGSQINPDSMIISQTPGSTFSVVIDEGETYTFLCGPNADTLNYTPTGSTISVNENQGLTGVRIVADKPISVLSGTNGTNIGIDEYLNCGAADLTCTHLKPIDKWSDRFLTTQTLVRPLQMALITTLRTPAPLNVEPYPANNNSRSVSDYLLITARDNGTVVNISGNATYSKTLNSGEWFIYESPGNSNPSTPPPGTDPGATHHLITSNNPIQVIQMMKGWQCDNVNPADPTQMLVLEEDTWDDNYIITNPTQYANNFFAFIIREPNNNSDARNTLQLTVAGSNVPIAAGVSPSGDGNGGWTQIGTTPYYFQRLTINAGSAVKARSLPQTPGGPTYPFAFYASGSSNASSYGYMGGAVCQLEAFTSVAPDTVCLGDLANLNLDSTQNGGTVNGAVQYDYTWNVYDNAGTQVYTFTGQDATADHSYTTANSGDLYAVLEVNDNAGCYARDTAYFFVSAQPDVADLADFSSCGNTQLPAITGTDLTGNQAYYSGTGGTGTQYLPGATINTSGTYYIYDAVAPGCSDEEDVVITINSSPTVDPASITTQCDGAGTSYTLSFTVSGGTGGPYTVNEVAPGGTGGTFSGNTYTTNAIANNTAYNFEVTDANGCPPVVVSGNNNCNCTSDAGTMDVNPLSNCDNGSLTGPAGTVVPNLDADDVESFILHTSSGGTAGTVIAQGTNSTFQFDAATMTYGTTYYISRVVGNDDGNLLADPNDPCYDVAAGTPVTWNEPVTVTMTSGGDVCAGTASSLELSFTGPGPFNVIYSNGSSNQNILGANNPHSQAVTPNSTTTYTLVSASSTSNGCSADFGGNPPSVTINTFDAPSSQNLVENCDQTNTSYTVSFDVVNGDPATYSVVVNAPMGVTGTLTGTTWTSDAIPSGTAYDFSLSDGNGCAVETITGNNTCVCTSDAGGMDVTPLSICGNGMQSGQVDPGQPPFLDGNDVIGFVLHDNSGNTLGSVFGQNTTGSFGFNTGSMAYGTTYYISRVVGSDDGTGNVNLSDPCMDVAFGTPVTWEEVPTAQASSNGPICSGAEMLLMGTTTNPQGTETYAWTGSGGFFSTEQNPSMSAAPVAANGQYILTVTLGNCSDDDTINVQVDQTAQANFTYTLLNETSEPHHVQFNNTSNGANGYLWDFGDGTTSVESDPAHQYTATEGLADVQLIAFGPNGCHDTITIQYNLLVIPENDTVLIYMPNSFTPDGNEYNQNFKPVFNESVDYTNFDMKVYNRWGELVFQSNDPDIGWDGSYQSKLSPSGLYTWVVEYSDKHTLQLYKVEGHVNLLR